tara:strand:+ start:4572 stop:5510 length:939 start_codon:yes stop_codon:yes gene_type:complete
MELKQKKAKPLIGVSGCLLGEEIRYNGQHKKHPHILHDMAKDFNYISFCPEVSMGLGIPRAAVHLAEVDGKPHLVNAKDSSIDHTELAQKTFEKITPELKETMGLVFTKGSPSCGKDPVRLYHAEKKVPLGKSKGLFAQHIEQVYPLIPKIDSGRLYDKDLRENFCSQVHCFHEFQTMEKRPRSLVKFHEEHKFYILQYGDKFLKKLGRICSGIDNKNIKGKWSLYEEVLFMETFKESITVKKRTNVIEHMAGFFKKELSKSDKNYLHESIMAYHDRKLSFETLLVLIYYLTESKDQAYLKNQKIFKYYSKL